MGHIYFVYKLYSFNQFFYNFYRSVTEYSCYLTLVIFLNFTNFFETCDQDEIFMKSILVILLNDFKSKYAKNLKSSPNINNNYIQT